MIEAWQNLPTIVPSAISIWGLELKLYSLAYLLGVFSVMGFVYFQDVRGRLTAKRSDYEDLIFVSFLSAILGGRVFYILFYNLEYFLARPVEMFWPFLDGKFVGFYGLSFHGGLFFSLLAIYIVQKKRKLPWNELQYVVLLPVCLALMFGRLGNFFNGELFGRETTLAIGMNFDGVLRHPSQLYQALAEGPVLMSALYILRNKFGVRNLLSWFLGLYGLFRFMIEFVREPDSQIGLLWLDLSMGQWLCVGMILLAICVNRIKFLR